MPKSALRFFTVSSNQVQDLPCPPTLLFAFAKLKPLLHQIKTDLKKGLSQNAWVARLTKLNSFTGQQPIAPRYYVYFLQEVKIILDRLSLSKKHYLPALNEVENKFRAALTTETKKLVAYFALDLWQCVHSLKSQSPEQRTLAINALRQSLRFYKTLLPGKLYAEIRSILNTAAYAGLFKNTMQNTTWHAELLAELEAAFWQIPPNFRPKMAEDASKTEITLPLPGKLFAAFLLWLNNTATAAPTSTTSTFTLPAQRNAHLFPLSNNQTLAVWQSITTLNAALLDNNGQVIKSVLSEDTSDQQIDYCAIALPEGGFIIIWCQNQQNILGQVFDAQGDFFRIISIPGLSSTFQSSPTLAQVSNSTLLLIWQSQQQSNSYLMKQTFSLAGLPEKTPARLNPLDTTFQMTPALASLQPEGCVLTWSVRGQTPNDLTRVYVQSLDAQGQLLYTPKAVDTISAAHQLHPTCTTLKQGNALVTWQQTPLNNQPNRIYGQFLDELGHLVGSVFQVSQITTEPISEQAASVIPLTNGNALINWLSQASRNPLMDLSARIFMPDGTPYGMDTIFLRTIQNNTDIIPAFGSLFNGNLLIGPEIKNNITASVINTQITLVNGERDIRYGEDETFIFQSPLQIDTPPFAKISLNLRLSDTQAGTLFSQVTANQLPSSNWSMTDTVTNVNRALASLQFKPAHHYYKNFTIIAAMENGFVLPVQNNVSAIGYPIDHGPQIQFPIPDQELEVGKSFQFTIAEDTFIDEYNDIVAYEAFLMDGRPLAATNWLSFTSPSRTFSGTPPNAEQLRIGVRAIDSRNLSIDDAFNLNFKGVTPYLLIGFISGAALSFVIIISAVALYHYRHRISVWKSGIFRTIPTADDTQNDIQTANENEGQNPNQNNNTGNFLVAKCRKTHGKVKKKFMEWVGAEVPKTSNEEKTMLLEVGYNEGIEMDSQSTKPIVDDNTETSQTLNNCGKEEEPDDEENKETKKESDNTPLLGH